MARRDQALKIYGNKTDMKDIKIFWYQLQNVNSKILTTMAREPASTDEVERRKVSDSLSLVQNLLTRHR